MLINILTGTMQQQSPLRNEPALVHGLGGLGRSRVRLEPFRLAHDLTVLLQEVRYLVIQL